MTEAEQDHLWSAVDSAGERIANLESTLAERQQMMRDVIHGAVREAMPRALLTDKQHQWVELAIEREAQSIKLRQAVIEKTLHALVWMFIVGIGLAMREYVIAHGMWKP